MAANLSRLMCLGPLLLLGSRAAHAQPAPPTTFEAAAVHALPPNPTRNPPPVRESAHGNLYSLRGATMVDLIVSAYGVNPANVSSGPSWVEFDRFDIFTKSSGTTTRETRREMLRALLAERFHLTVHTAVKPLPAFVLSAGTSAKLKLKQVAAAPDSEDQPHGCEFQPPPKDAPPERMMNVSFACHATTMADFADFLHDVGEPYLPKPVVDATGLKGAWDFNIQWTYEPGLSGGITLFTALDKQLGLKLEAASAPQTALAIDSVDRKPTPDVADIDKLLPPPPPASFEVAIIRPANPNEKHFNIEIQNASVDVQFATLQTLIGFAWDVNVGRIGNKPKFLDVQHYDITGKASIDTDRATGNPMASRDIDVDDLKEMLRTLLIERFKMAVHMETQPMQAYTMVAAGPKLKPADPANHPSCKEGPGADGKDPRRETPILSRLISCQNMTMAQLAEELRTLASGYVPAPVIDATSLTGAYDFSISFSRSNELLRPGTPSADGSAPSEPNGALSLFDAMSRQLGIKLEKKDKVMVPMLVLDHIQENPTDN